MSADLATLRKVLSESRSRGAKRICSDPPQPLKKGDFAKIEQAILSHQETGDNAAELIELVRKTALEVETKPEVLEQSRIVIRYPVPKNPFAAEVNQAPIRDAEEAVERAAAWLAATRSAKSPDLAFYRFLVSAILEFRILHQDYIPAILRSLRDDWVVKLSSKLSAIPLSLSYGRQQNAEQRLLILRKESLRCLGDFLKISASGASSEENTANEVKVNASPRKIERTKFNTLLRELERTAAKEGPKIDPPLGPPAILDLIQHARILAMLHLPSVIVAHRSRLIVSHSIPPKVLGRIMGEDLDRFAPPPRRLRPVEDEPEKFEPAKEHDEPAKEHDEPKWMGELREALKSDELNGPKLDQLASGDDRTPKLLAEFARFLQNGAGPGEPKGCKPGTVRRYCLLIAIRLVPRLSSPIEEVTCDAWEDAIEQLLDEDAFYKLESSTAIPSSHAQLHSRPLVTAIRHWIGFLRQRCEDKELRARLAELLERLPVLGLVAVDASLITVDEYREALQRMVAVYAPSDEDELEAGRVALILGYRCGLRRNETAGLSVCDLDSADHLHVRANEMRGLKTSNARRDLPLRVLMPQDELEHVRRRAREVKRRADSAKLPYEQAYLFSMRDTPGKLMTFENVVARIHCAFRGDAELGWEAIDPTFHYHRLRHSFCNLMLLKLWPALGDNFLEFIKGKSSPKTKHWIGHGAFRKELFGTEQIKQGDLQGIALLMGHGSAAVSLEHYLHVLDFCEALHDERKVRSA